MYVYKSKFDCNDDNNLQLDSELEIMHKNIHCSTVDYSKGSGLASGIAWGGDLKMAIASLIFGGLYSYFHFQVLKKQST